MLAVLGQYVFFFTLCCVLVSASRSKFCFRPHLCSSTSTTVTDKKRDIKRLVSSNSLRTRKRQVNKIEKHRACLLNIYLRIMFSTLSLKQLEYELKHGVTASPVFQDHDSSQDIESPPPKPSTDSEPPRLSPSHDSPNVEPRQPSWSRHRSDDSEDVKPAPPSDHRHMSIDGSDIDPLQPPEPRPTSHESAAAPPPPPTSKHPRTTDDSSPPRSSKRGRRSGPRPAWSAREDEIVQNCVARGGTLVMAIAELREEGCGPPRSYEACVARWHRSIKLRTNELPGNHEPDSDYSPNAMLPQTKPTKSCGRRGNFTRVWRPREDDVLMLRYAGGDTDWVAVAAEINGLGCVATPRTPASCKARWMRRFKVHFDDSEEDNDDAQPDDIVKQQPQHRNRGKSVPTELPRTRTTSGDNPGPRPGVTLTTGDPEHEQIEACIVLRNPSDPSRNDEPALAERTLHSQTETCRPEPRSQPPTWGPDPNPRPPTSQPAVNAASREPNTQSSKLPLQDDAPRHAEQSPPRLELSADYLTPTDTGLSEEVTQSGLLSMAELAHNANPLARGAPQRPPVAGLPRCIDPIFLEKAANESAPMAPSTCILVCRAVARNVQRIRGAAAGSEAELMDEIAKDLEEGWHRSTVIAVRYKTLTGDDIEPELVETALSDIEAVQDGTSDQWLHFCVWVRQANLPPELAEGEKGMEDIEKLEIREAEVRAGKDKWRCVVARYRQLCRERR